MDMLREYLLRITAASLSCGILTGILGEKGTTGKTLRFICGMVMVISVSDLFFGTEDSAHETMGRKINTKTSDFIFITVRYRQTQH